MNSIVRQSSGWSHRLAVALFVGACPLVFVGAGVTSKDAGMAFSDWPLSGGHLVNPPGWTSKDDKLWEHSHRLIGWCVGILAIANVVVAIRQRRVANHVPLLAGAVLLAISLQGVLGGLRVRAVSTPLAMVHGAWGQICLSLAALLALLTSRAWQAAARGLSVESTSPAAPLLTRIGVATTLLVIVQLAAGVVLRHTGAGLAWHLVGAVVVVCLIAWLSLWTLSEPAAGSMAHGLARCLLTLVSAQLLLGVGAYVATQTPEPGVGRTVQWLLPTVHVLAGALLLAGCTGLTVWLRHHLRGRVEMHRPEVLAT